MKNDKLFKTTLLFSFLIASSMTLALPTSWNYTITSNNHVILVQQTIPLTIDGVAISPGDYIGVFYPNATSGLNCGGYMEYTGVLSNLTAWAEDVGNDGFPVGQEFIWKIWDSSANAEYIAYATYDETGAFPNAGLYVPNGMSGLLSLSGFSSPVPWNYTITATNHTILIPEDLTVFIDDSQFEYGDYIGVFFNDSTNLVCGGYAVWYGATTSLTAWGDDTQTPLIDGFQSGDEFVWKIWDVSANQQYFASASYMLPPMANQGFFEVNGMSGLDTLQVTIPWSVTITSTNHTILVPDFGSYLINNVPLAYGDYMGVFYDSVGILKCGGFAQWEGITTNISAWGEDLGNDGFAVGDNFIWKIFDASENMEYFATPTYMGPPMVNQGVFEINGMSGIESLHAQMNIVPWSFTITSTNHTIVLPEFSTYLLDGIPIEVGDYIGVFYDSLGVLACGGYQRWEGVSTAVAAWGDDTQSPAIDGFASGEALKWKIWDASEDTVYDCQATYIQPPTLPDVGYWVVNGMSGIEILETVIVNVPWNYINTGTNHTILVPATASLTIDTTSLEPGDYFGVFFDSLGVHVCAGYAEYTGDVTAVTAWGEDVGLDGFVTGEAFKWKIWDASEDTVIDAYATYSQIMPDQGFYTTNGMSALEALTTVEPFSIQTITLIQGWGIYSTYIDPFEPSADSVFADIVANVMIVKDGDGQIYWPQYNLNLIGDLVIGNGYQVKMIAQEILEIIGDAVVPEITPVTLNYNWGIYGYLRQAPGLIVEMLSPLASYIEIVKDGDGNIYWPQFGLDMIIYMLPGNGYQMKLTSAQILYYPPNSNITSKTQITDFQTSFYRKAKNTGSNMSLAIPSNAWPAGFKPNQNDEIGVFAENGQLVGSAKIVNENIAVSIWGNDKFTDQQDGLLQGDKFTLRFWSHDGTENILAVTEWDQGDESYAENKISIAKSVTIRQNFRLGQNFPNPFSQSTEISVFLPSESIAQIKIYNEFGVIVKEIDPGFLKKGLNKVSINSTDLAPGNYFYQFVSKDFVETKSMQIIR